MSADDKARLVDRVVKSFDTRLALSELFRRNAQIRHGIPMEDVGVVPLETQERTTSVDLAAQQKPPVAEVVPQQKTGGLLSQIPKWALLVAGLMSGGVGAAAIPTVVNWLFPDKPSVEQAVEKSGSIFQYLEDRGFHRDE